MPIKLLLFSGVILLSSCIDNSENLTLQNENKILATKVDSLENVLSQNFDPFIINSGNWELYDGDTATFVVGLMNNNESIIDSIHMSLYKVDDQSNKEFLYTNLFLPSKSDDRTYGLGRFQLPNLEKGKYLYDGFIVFKGEKKDIQHYFEVVK